MPSSPDEEFDGTPLEGDRPGPHPVDVLGELPIDGEQTRETQLMSDAELDPREIEGDRFDVAGDDLGTPPDLEDDPDAPDLRPDHVERIGESGIEGEPDELGDEEEGLTARPTVRRRPDDALVEPTDPGDPGETP